MDNIKKLIKLVVFMKLQMYFKHLFMNHKGRFIFQREKIIYFSGEIIILRMYRIAETVELYWKIVAFFNLSKSISD